MEFWPIYGAFFWAKRRSKTKSVVLWKPIKTLRKTYFFKVWGMLLEAKIGGKTACEMGWILEGIFYGFRLHFGGHFGAQNSPKSMPKIDEKQMRFGMPFWRRFGDKSGRADGGRGPVGASFRLVLAKNLRKNPEHAGPWRGAADCNRFASPAGPGSGLMMHLVLLPG